MSEWKNIPLSAKLYQNAAESVLRGETAALENAYVTAVGSLSRFPQLVDFIDLPLASRVYLEELRGDLIASCGGRTYRIDINNVTSEDLTGAAVSGNGRTTFAKTDDDQLLMAAGGKIITLKSKKTTILSDDAPETTHVGYKDGYAMAAEKGSGRFNISKPGQYNVWDPLDIFSAEGNPDNINALLITENEELILAGPASIEQFDSAPSGIKPFFKRWGLGNGLLTPYAFLSAQNRIWGFNQDREWTAYSSQIGDSASKDIEARLETLDDITEAWASKISVDGQKFQILQFPNATNVYGTKGVTFLYDYLKNRWGALYGWNQQLAVPDRWPGWSVKQIGERKFIGGEGKIYELKGNAGVGTQRFLWRSGHLDFPGSVDFRINRLRMRIERGEVAQNAAEPVISMRCNKNNRGFGRWMRRGLGLSGKRHMILEFPSVGIANSFQFEIMVTDDIAIKLSKVDMHTTPMA